MKILVSLLVALASNIVIAQSACDIIAGGTIIADDGTLLGRLTNSYSADSILNEYGTHGSTYSTKSIWNEYGTYGGKYSNQSPFNEYTSTPPTIIKNGRAIARLTVNKSLRGALNPYVVKTCDF
jgi:hypothetical protein